MPPGPPPPRLAPEEPLYPSPAAQPGASGRPIRRLVGGDILLTTYPAEPDRLTVDAGFVVQGWEPRPPARLDRAAFPGTGLLVRGRWWEIVARDGREGPDGKPRVLYELIPWGQQALRKAVELTPETARILTDEHRAVASREQEARRAVLFTPILGLLPAADQRELETRLGLVPGRATSFTAMIMVAFCVYALVLAIADALGFAGGSHIALAGQLIWLSGYLFVESIFRLAEGMRGRSMGSALVVVPLGIVRAFGQQTSPDDQLAATPSALGREERNWMEATDKVYQAPPAEDGRPRIEVLSPLPKDHWRANVDLIYYADRPWTLADRKQVPGGHRFLLEAPLPGLRTHRAVHRYHPEEVREVYKETRRLKAETWIEALAPLVGLTNPSLQVELAEIYGFRPYRAVAQSVFFGVLVGLVSLRTGTALASPQDVALDHVLMVLFGAGLLIESINRGRRLLAGEISDSVLGRPIESFVRRALRWRHDPSWPYARGLGTDKPT